MDDERGERLLQIAKRISARAWKTWPTFLRNNCDEVYSEALVAVVAADRGDSMADIRYWFHGIELRAWGCLVQALRRDKFLPKRDQILPNVYQLPENYQGAYDEGTFTMLDDLDEIEDRLAKGTGKRKKDERLLRAWGIIRSKLDLVKEAV